MWSVFITVSILAVAASPSIAAVIGSTGARNITLTKLTNPNARAAISEYYYSMEETDYFTAVDTCKDYSLRILQEKTSTKILEVSRVLAANQVEEPVWLGLTDVTVDGTWKWYDGSGLSPTVRANWAENNGGVGEDDCSILDPETYKWSERSCKGSCTLYRFICEPLNA